jgi:hypothetical protein
MADGSSVQPIAMIPNMEMVVQGHVFTISMVIMDLSHQDDYPDKVEAILKAPAPHNTKALSRFLGQIQWHRRMICHLIDFATPLHVAVHREPFTWTREEEKAFCNLKTLVDTSSSGATPGLGAGVPCICGCIRHSNRQCTDIEVRKELVLTRGKKELFNNRTGGSWHDLQCDKVLSLSAWKEVHIPRGSFGTGVGQLLRNYNEVVNS